MILDAHTHVGVVWPEEGVRATVAQAIGMMDRSDTDLACTSASRLLRCDLERGNRITLDAVRAYPDRLIGYVIASPHQLALSLTECDRYLGVHGFRGIKVHRSHTQMQYNDPRYNDIYAKADEYAVPVLGHCFSPDEVRQFTDAAARFPEVPFVVGHSGGYAWAECVEDIAYLPNTYFDVCTSCADRGRVEAFVQAAGAERVLLGTDLPMLEPMHCIAQVLAADLTPHDRELILGLNAKRLLGL